MKKIIAALLFSLAFSSVAFAQPEIKILATGGTIAGRGSSAQDVSNYKAGELGIQTLIDAVPEIKQYAKVSGEQICNIDSSSMTYDIWLKLAKRCNELLADDNVKGIVITHGTDTLEETAYFLNLVIKSEKPVVLVGSMRPATAISADGPLNLLEAVRVAVEDNSKGMGVLVVLNDYVNSARNVQKTNTSNVATFQSPEIGALGYVKSDKIIYYNYNLRRHTTKSEFDVSKLDALPRVDIVYSHVNDDRVMVDAAVKAGAKGIIHVGTGDGSIHRNALPGIIDAVKNNVIVVKSSRTGSGYVTIGDDNKEYGILSADNLSPAKARVLLALALTKTKDLKEIQRMFDEY